MDYEAGPDPTLMTYHDLSRHGISSYAFYFYLASAFTFTVPSCLHLALHSASLITSVAVICLSVIRYSFWSWSGILSLHICLLYAHTHTIYTRTYIDRLHILIELISLVVSYHNILCTPILVARGWNRSYVASVVNRMCRRASSKMPSDGIVTMVF